MKTIFKNLEIGFKKQGSAVDVKKTFDNMGFAPKKQFNYGKV